LDHFGLGLADLTTLRRFRRVKEALDLIGGTGQPAADFLAWAVAGPDAALDRRDQAATASPPGRPGLAIQPAGVNDQLRNRRREALVSYILQHAPPTPAIDTADKLYEHFLIDVEMDACMQTSRVRSSPVHHPAVHHPLPDEPGAGGRAVAEARPSSGPG
jgi:hypothetical protein